MRIHCLDNVEQRGCQREAHLAISFLKIDFATMNDFVSLIEKFLLKKVFWGLESSKGWIFRLDPFYKVAIPQ